MRWTVPFVRNTLSVCSQRSGLCLQVNIASLVQTVSVFPPVYTRPLLTWQRPNVVLDPVLVSVGLWLVQRRRRLHSYRKSIVTRPAHKAGLWKQLWSPDSDDLTEANAQKREQCVQRKKKKKSLNILSKTSPLKNLVLLFLIRHKDYVAWPHPFSVLTPSLHVFITDVGGELHPPAPLI